MKKVGWSCVILFLTVLAVAGLPACVDTKTPARAEDSELPAADQSQKSPAEPGQADRTETLPITGQMTLAEIERGFGVSPSDVAEKLNLPPGVAKDETLGKLRQSYPFTMDQVRDIVTDLAEDAGSAAIAGVQSSERAEQATLREEPLLTRGRGAEAQTGVLITGQMTLREIESRSGVSARLIADKLRLPPSDSLEVPLGKLRRTYRFTMQDVRSIVSEQLKQPGLQPSPPGS